MEAVEISLTEPEGVELSEKARESGLEVELYVESLLAGYVDMHKTEEKSRAEKCR